MVALCAGVYAFGFLLMLPQLYINYMVMTLGFVLFTTVVLIIALHLVI